MTINQFMTAIPSIIAAIWVFAIAVYAQDCVANPDTFEIKPASPHHAWVIYYNSADMCSGAIPNENLDVQGGGAIIRLEVTQGFETIYVTPVNPEHIAVPPVADVMDGERAVICVGLTAYCEAMS